jgi:uncharacterized protein (TIGR02453 family)
MAPHFPAGALSFLRALVRHNDRDWFRERRERYERELRAPMAAIVEQLDRDFRTFAPDLVATPKRSIFRIYRDTRFSEDKSPLKTHVAAAFPHRQLRRNTGAALYLELNARTVLMAGGLYAPASPELRAVRLHIADNLARFRTIVEAPRFVRQTGGLQGERLSRMPRGFPPDHRASDYLRMKQFLIWKELPAPMATSPRFYGSLLHVFRAASPLVRFLNEPLTRPTSFGA